MKNKNIKIISFAIVSIVVLILNCVIWLITITEDMSTFMPTLTTVISFIKLFYEGLKLYLRG